MRVRSTLWGVMYFCGLDVAKDHKEAVKWYKQSALGGDMYGQYSFGEMRENGWGIEKNMAEAKTWYQKSADQGYDRAIEKLKELSGTTTSSTSGKTYEEYEKMADEFYDKRITRKH